MTSSVTDHVRSVLNRAAGLPEPDYGSSNEAANWPAEFRQVLRACMEAISRETDPSELERAVAELGNTPANAPSAIGIILSKALYDNVNTPLA